jgi:hypothetical protein
LYIGIGHCDGTFRWRTWGDNRDLMLESQKVLT